MHTNTQNIVFIRCYEILPLLNSYLKQRGKKKLCQQANKCTQSKITESNRIQ